MNFSASILKAFLFALVVSTSTSAVPLHTTDQAIEIRADSLEARDVLNARQWSWKLKVDKDGPDDADDTDEED